MKARLQNDKKNDNQTVNQVSQCCMIYHYLSEEFTIFIVHIVPEGGIILSRLENYKKCFGLMENMENRTLKPTKKLCLVFHQIKLYFEHPNYSGIGVRICENVQIENNSDIDILSQIDIKVIQTDVANILVTGVYIALMEFYSKNPEKCLE